MPCSFDGDGQFSLMRGTNSGDSSGQDFAALGSELRKDADIFVINVVDFVSAKLAELAFSGHFYSLAGYCVSSITLLMTLASLGSAARFEFVRHLDFLIDPDGEIANH